MPRRVPIVIAFVLVGCGSFLGLNSGDDDDPPKNPTPTNQEVDGAPAALTDEASIAAPAQDAGPDSPHGCVILGGKCGSSDQCCGPDKADTVVHRCGDDSHCLRCLNVGSTGCRFNLNMNCCPGTICSVGDVGGLDAAPSQFRCCIEEGEACTSSADCCVGTCNKLKCAESI